MAEALAPDQRIIVTPEGIPITISLAGLGERFTALVIDLLVIALIATIVIVVTFLVLAIAGSEAGWPLAVASVGLFVVRAFYFLIAELHGQGRTIGKKVARIRVIDAGGGVLSPDALIARNLMRELELFLPVGLLLGAADLGGWGAMAALVWIGAILAIPVFAKRRQRLGDMIGGTLVVREARPVLLPDMAETIAPESAEDFVFTRDQLDIYGIREVQVLEEVLRLHGPGRQASFDDVAARIARKIGWQAQDGSTPQGDTAEPFLRAFYAALRARLEARLLLGVRKKDKTDQVS